MFQNRYMNVFSHIYIYIYIYDSHDDVINISTHKSVAYACVYDVLDLSHTHTHTHTHT